MKSRWIIVAVSIAVAAAGMVGCSSETSTTAGARCEYRATGDPGVSVNPPSTSGFPTTGTATYTVTMNGTPFQITVDQAHAPCAANSFNSLVAQKFYDDTVCHRVTSAGYYVLQCGKPKGGESEGPGYEFNEEVTGKEVYSAGVVAMAKTQYPNTTGSQFFIVYGDSAFPPEYTILGSVDAAGLKKVTSIAAAGSNPPGDGPPVSEVRISAVTKN